MVSQTLTAQLETGHWPLGVVESLDGRIDAWSEVLMGRHSEAAKEYADALRHYQAAAALNAPQVETWCLLFNHPASIDGLVAVYWLLVCWSLAFASLLFAVPVDIPF